MTKLIVAIQVFGKMKDVWSETNAQLTLESEVAVTPEDTKNKTFGIWTSPSILLGKSYRGRYYVQNIKMSDEERWSSNTTYEFNPYGFFFDTDQFAPFLVLNLFEPLSMNKPGRSGGSGQLLRTSQPIPTSTLRWYVDSGKTQEELRKELLEKLNTK